MKKPKLIVNVHCTQYDVVKEVAQDVFHYKNSYSAEGEWDLFWVDTGVTSEILSKMRSYQKINHFPNMSCLARKNNLGKNLMRMRKEFPKDYNFFPPTWLLPVEQSEFRNELAQGKGHTYIFKPEALSQGKGIFLSKSLDGVDLNAHYVVQRYLSKPYLIEGLKFDLRIYVLVYGCDPLRIYIFKEGLNRLATEEYQAPTRDNIDNVYMHLTNYAINKNSENFVFNTDEDKADVGNKRSLDFTWRYIDAHGGNSKLLQRKIRRSIVKTLCSVQPQLGHSYRSCQPNDIENNMCFEILGFDILLDHKLKPWLLEVNHSPSFTTDTPFDHKVKAELLTDTIRILHMNTLNRVKYYQQKQEESNSRVMSRGTVVKMTKEEKDELRKAAMLQRDKYELKNLGGYTRIYPDEKMAAKYESFIASAEVAWQGFFGIRRRPAVSVKGDKSRPPLRPVNKKPGAIPARAKSGTKFASAVAERSKERLGTQNSSASGGKSRMGGDCSRSTAAGDRSAVSKRSTVTEPRDEAVRNRGGDDVGRTNVCFSYCHSGKVLGGEEDEVARPGRSDVNPTIQMALATAMQKVLPHVVEIGGPLAMRGKTLEAEDQQRPFGIFGKKVVSMTRANAQPAPISVVNLSVGRMVHLETKKSLAGSDFKYVPEHRNRLL